MAARKLQDIIKRLIDSKPVNPYLCLFAMFASRKLREAEKRTKTTEDYVKLAFHWQPLSFHIHDILTIKPAQVKGEITQLLSLISQRRPRTILEIGTALGGTLYLFAKVSDPAAMILSVDLPGGKFGGGYPRWKIPLYKSFAINKQKIHLIRGNSHDPLVTGQIKRILNGRMLDFLFIDGDHTLEGVTNDFRTYGPLVRAGGLVAFHDIVPHPIETKCEVNKLWAEIRQSYPHLEIIENSKLRSGGVGLLYMNRFLIQRSDQMRNNTFPNFAKIAA